MWSYYACLFIRDERHAHNKKQQSDKLTKPWNVAAPQPMPLSISRCAGRYAARFDVFKARRLRCTELRLSFGRVSDRAVDRWFKDKTLKSAFCCGAVDRTLFYKPAL